MLSGSKYCGFGANDAPAECSMPWSTGRIERYPVPASRPLSKSDCIERKTAGERSGLGPDAIDEIRPGQIDLILRDRFRFMVEQRTRVVAQEFFDAVEGRSGSEFVAMFVNSS